jgi:hypothetical protein
MRYIEAPEEYIPDNSISLFLAGGITGCPDWQSDIVRLFDDTSLTLLNPRRANFPIADPSAAEAQIRWEHEHLRRAVAVLFWFPRESLCPIVLYELGAWSMTNKPLFIGVHQLYQRKKDVEVQTHLARPDVQVVYSLRDVAKIVKSTLV